VQWIRDGLNPIQGLDQGVDLSTEFFYRGIVRQHHIDIARSI
jgi:hypothetical protein